MNERQTSLRIVTSNWKSCHRAALGRKILVYDVLLDHGNSLAIECLVNKPPGESLNPGKFRFHLEQPLRLTDSSLRYVMLREARR